MWSFKQKEKKKKQQPRPKTNGIVTTGFTCTEQINLNLNLTPFRKFNSKLHLNVKHKIMKLLTENVGE